MPLVLSQILDPRTIGEERRIDLFGAVPHLRAVDLYLTREDAREARSKERELRRAFGAACLGGQVTSARVFLPPYAPRDQNGEYLPEAYAEIDRVLDVADWFRDALRIEGIGLSFHHVTEWPTEIDGWLEEELAGQLAQDRATGFRFAAEVALRCRARDVVPALENVAPVRNDHAVPGALRTPRYETGFCGPDELRDACGRIEGLQVALDVCHLALGYEAEREGRRPRINALELERDSAARATPPYDFARAVEAVAPHLACVHVSGCSGGRKETHEGGIPEDPGDRIDLRGLLGRLARAEGDRTLPLVVEIQDGHTDGGFERVETALRRVAAALQSLGAAHG